MQKQCLLLSKESVIIHDTRIMGINKRTIVIQILITTVKVSTQFTGCWVVLILINYLIISNTVFQIAVTTLSLAPAGTGIASRGSGSHLGGDIAPGPAAARHTNS